MQRSHAYLLAASLLALAGCRDDTSPLSPRSDNPASQAQAQADGPGSIDTSFPTLTPPLVFLEPLGGAPRDLPGVFDPSLSPVVELCPAEGACDAPLARWAGGGAEGVRVAGNHYHLSWHTGRTPVRAGETYRLRVRLGENEAGSLRVAVVASGGERRAVTGADVAVKAGQTVPVKFWIQKVRRLTVRLYPGATGSPASLDTLVGYGERVPYAYAAAEGYGTVGVSVDGRGVPVSGEVVMDADHLLLAGGDRAVTLPPGTEPLAASARAVLTAADPVEAMRLHVQATTALYRTLEPRVARARLDSVYRVALDPVADSAALRRVSMALRNHVTIVRPDGTVQIRPAGADEMAAAASRTRAGARLSLSDGYPETPRRTVYYYVNGIFYTGADVFSIHQYVQRMVHDEANVPEDPARTEVRFFYNASFLDAPALYRQEVTACFTNLFTRFDLLSIPTFGIRLASCTVAISNPASQFDLVELARQILQIRGIDHTPPPQDAIALADELRGTLRRNESVVFVAESQGNLMVQQALKQVQMRPDLFAGRACVGVVSMSAPISHGAWYGLDEGAQVRGVVLKHDIVRYLLQNHLTPTETAKTREWDGHIAWFDRGFWWTVILPLSARIAAGVDTHLVPAYFDGAESREKIVSALAELPGVLADIPGCQAQVQTGEVSGRVTHAQTGAGIAGAQVSWSYIASPATTAADGRFTARIPVGRVDLSVSAPGFIPTTLYGVNVSTVASTLETVRLVPFSTQPGTISGAVRDARNANGISGATVEVRAGMNATSGTPVATVTSGAGGAYRVPNLPAGTYSVRAVAGGFAAGVATGIAVGTAEVNNQDVVLAPMTDDITVVLTWGATPRDLDSHLTGPLEAGGRFHVYYNYGGSLTASPWASLDVDNTGGYGPETITIRRMFSGVYRYSVHDYSNRGFGGSLAMSNSGARVRVFRGGTLLRDAYVPPGRPGSLWTVFELDVNATGGVALRMVDAVGNEVNSGAVTSRAPVPGAAGSDARVIGQAVAEAAKP